MSERNYLAEIEEIDRQHKELMEKRNAIIDEWVEAEHPLKVGDVVGCTYSHSGKRIIVNQIGIHSWLGVWEWTAYGSVLKKDGTPGLLRGEWYQKVEV